MTRVFNQNTSSVNHSNLNYSSINEGAVVIQCGHRWLYVSHYNNTVVGGSLIELDPVTGELMRVQSTRHTIATGLPYTVQNANDGTSVATAISNGTLYMFIRYSAYNPHIVYRGVWNETTLQFENFAQYVVFSTSPSLNGSYSVLAWDRADSMYIATNNNTWSRFRVSDGVILSNASAMNTNNSGWGPSSYTFSNGYYTDEGYILGKSGDGTNWYSMATNGYCYYSPPNSSWSSYAGYGINGLYGQFTPYYCHMSNFHKKMYYVTGSTVYAYVMEAAIFVNPALSQKTKTILTTTYNNVLLTDPSAIIHAGALEIKTDSESIQTIKTYAGYVSDVILTSNALFAVSSSGSVEKWDVDSDGLPITNKGIIDWGAGDSILNTNIGLNSSAPSAYTTFRYNNINYLVAMDKSSATIYTWVINDNGTLSGRQSFTGVSSFSSYGRAGWDGSSYVYFVKSNGTVYRWTIMTNTITTIGTLTTLGMEYSSFTGSGLIVKNNNMYISSARNSSSQRKIIIYDVNTLAIKNIVRENNILPLLSATGSIVLSHFSKYAYVITSSGLKLLPMSWRATDNWTVTPPLKQKLDGYDAIPYLNRTVGNKSIGPLVKKQVLTQMAAGVSIANIMYGSSKVYVIGSDNITYIYNKEADGSIGTYYTSTSWGGSLSYITETLNNSLPMTLIVENGQDKIIAFSYMHVTTSGAPLLYEMTLSSNGTYSTWTNYTSPSIFNSYVGGGAMIGKAAWDGSRYVYFLFKDTIWRWDTLNKNGGVQYISSILNNENYLRAHSAMYVDNDYIYFGEYFHAGYALQSIPRTGANANKFIEERVSMYYTPDYFDYFGDSDQALAYPSNTIGVGAGYISPLRPNTMIVATYNTSTQNKVVYTIDVTYRKDIIPLDLETHANVIKKENIDNVRIKVNEFRVNNGLVAVKWTDPNIVAGLSPIKAIHWNEINSAIDDVYSTQKVSYKSAAVSTKIQETITAKTPVYRVMDLRSRLMAIILALRNG